MNASLVTFGFLPVIVFLAAHRPLGERKALWCALAGGAAQSGWTAATERATDWMGAAGFALLAATVFLSQRRGDAFYFKIHGAITDAISSAVLLAGWFVGRKALLLDAAAKEVGLERLASLDPSLTRETVSELLRVLSFHLPWWLALHALITVYAAANWGKWGWAFVRVPGFLIMLFLATGFAQAAIGR